MKSERIDNLLKDINWQSQDYKTTIISDDGKRSAVLYKDEKYNYAEFYHNKKHINTIKNYEAYNLIIDIKRWLVKSHCFGNNNHIVNEAIDYYRKNKKNIIGVLDQSGILYLTDITEICMIVGGNNNTGDTYSMNIGDFLYIKSSKRYFEDLIYKYGYVIKNVSPVPRLSDHIDDYYILENTNSDKIIRNNNINNETNITLKEYIEPRIKKLKKLNRYILNEDRRKKEIILDEILDAVSKS